MLLAVVVDEVGTGRLGDRVLAVDGEEVVLLGPGRVLAVLRRAAGVDVGRDVARREALEQGVRAHQVGAQDQLAVGLERVRAVGDAVEDGARLHLVEHPVDVERHERVELADVAGRQVLEPPGGRAARGRDDVGAVLEQRAREIGAHEAAGPEHEDRALQRADAIAGSHATRRSGSGRRSRCSSAVSASAPAERPCRSCRNSALPVSPTGERRTPARTRRVARPFSATTSAVSEPTPPST